MSATLESRTLIVSARRLRVLKTALAGMEIEAIEPAEWVDDGGAGGGFAHHAAPRGDVFSVHPIAYRATVFAEYIMFIALAYLANDAVPFGYPILQGYLPDRSRNERRWYGTPLPGSFG